MDIIDIHELGIWNPLFLDDTGKNKLTKANNRINYITKYI
jgi:hypothetical protein